MSRRFKVLFCMAIPLLATAIGLEAAAAPPAPLALQVTPFALTPMPFDAPAQVWFSVAGGRAAEWRRLRAEYSQSEYADLRLGAMGGHDLPWKIPCRISYGGEITLLSATGLEVKVPPAIDEHHRAVGLDTTRLFVDTKVLDSEKLGWKLAGFRLRAGVFLRATVDTSTLSSREGRHPLLAWHEVLGPRADHNNAALLEMGGFGVNVSGWDDRFALQAHWSPVVWGVVAGGGDRFLTHLHLVLAGRPLPYLEVVAETFGVAAYDDTPYAAEVAGGGVGFGLRGRIQRWTVESGFRYGFGDTRSTYGQWVVGARVGYRLSGL